MSKKSETYLVFQFFMRERTRSLFFFQKFFRKVRTSLPISPLSSTEGQKAPRKGGMSDVQKENQAAAVGRGTSARDKRNAVGVSHYREAARQETRRLSDAQRGANEVNCGASRAKEESQCKCQSERNPTGINRKRMTSLAECSV